MVDIEEAKRYLKSYQKLNAMGTGGKMLSPEATEFYKDKQEHESILDWCIRKALEALSN